VSNNLEYPNMFLLVVVHQQLRISVSHDDQHLSYGKKLYVSFSQSHMTGIINPAQLSFALYIFKFKGKFSLHSTFFSTNSQPPCAVDPVRFYGRQISEHVIFRAE
jgi:hypothetical protein